MLIPINQIAAATEVAFFDIQRAGGQDGEDDLKWLPQARTALEPLHSVKSGDDFYGVDKATIVIDGFLKASTPWKGALATHLKRQLKDHLHENHQS